MSLAALAGYVSSDDSGSDNESQNEKQNVNVPNLPPKATGVDSIVDDDDYDDVDSHVTTVDKSGPSSLLFSSLPAPKSANEETLKEEETLEDEKIAAPLKPAKRRIMIPKLSELDDDLDKEENGPSAKKKVIKSSAGSGLLKMLPPPATVPVAKGSKTTVTQLTPHSLGRKPPPPKPKKLPPKPTAKPVEVVEEDDAEEGPTNFFSFDEPKLSDEQLKNLITAEDLKPREKRPPSPEVGPVFANAEEIELEPEPLPAVSTSGVDEIPAEALAQLRGRRNEKIEVFSIDAAEFAAEARSNLAKNLTVEDSRPRSEGPEPSRLHKSKHHITHLAFQAKARENELKNQWATNRMTKRETQRKYGF